MPRSSYLHSLEQEVAVLRAQIQSMASGSGSTTHGSGSGSVPSSADHIGQTKREIAHGASQAVASFRPDFPSSSSSANGSSIPIDPSLTGGDPDPPQRSHPWDLSPRRGSDQFPLAPMADTLHGRSGSFSGGTPATSLTRLVHDAALGTGHASNPHSTINQPRSNASGSEKGSTTDSPMGLAQGLDLPERTPSISNSGTLNDPFPTPKSLVALSHSHSHSGSHKSAGGHGHGHTASPHSSSTNSKPKRHFAIPPLPPQPAVERLVAAYVDFVGVTAPIIHIPTLGKQLIKIREGGPDVEESDVFIVMMMLGELFMESHVSGS